MRLLLPSLLALLILASCTADPKATQAEQTAPADQEESFEPREEKVKKEILEKPIETPKADFSSFIKEGYLLMDSAAADLNQDGYPDMALALKTTDDELNPESRRPLLILLGQADGSYKQAAVNEETIYCKACGGAMGEPFVGLTANKGELSIDHYGGSGWRWSVKCTFKFDQDKQDWLLHSLEKESYHSGDPESTYDEQRLTPSDFGTVPFEHYRWEDKYGE